MYRSPPCAEGVGRYLKLSQITIFIKRIGVTTCMQWGRCIGDIQIKEMYEG